MVCGALTWLVTQCRQLRPDSLEVRLTHASGETSVVNIMETKVIIYNSGGQFEQQFAASSLVNLLAIIGGASGYPDAQPRALRSLGAVQ